MEQFRATEVVQQSLSRGIARQRASERAFAAPTTRDARWNGLVAVLFLYVMFDIGRLHLLFQVLRPFHPAMICALAAIALWLQRPGLLVAISEVRSTAAFCVVGMCVWAAMSVPGSLYPGASFRFLVGDFCKTILMSFVIATAVRGPRDVERLLGALFLAALVYALVILRRFDIGPGERLGALYTYDANDLGQLLVCVLPFSLYLVLRNPWLVRRTLAIAALAAFAMVMVWTGSRGALLALVAVILAVVIGWKSIALRRRALGVTVGFIMFLAVANRGYWDQMSTLLTPHDDYNVTSATGRIQIWKRGIGYILQRPLLGVGLNQFAKAEGQLSQVAADLLPGMGFKWSAPHNSFLQIGAELGVPGLLLFVTFTWQLFRFAAALRRQAALWPSHLAPPGPPLAEVLVPTLVGFFVAGFFLSQAYSSLLYFLAAVVLGLYRVRPRRRPVGGPMR